jgi:hypothetical protein
MCLFHAVPPLAAPAADAADPEAFTMNSMARGTFHIYTPWP